MTGIDLLAIAKTTYSRDEVRCLVDAEIAEQEIETQDLHMVLGKDLIADAALEVMSGRTEFPPIGKTLVLDDTTTVSLAETGLVRDLRRDFEAGHVTEEEMQHLLLRGSVAHALSQALEQGIDPSELAQSTISIAPIGLRAFTDPPQRRGILARWFSR